MSTTTTTITRKTTPKAATPKKKKQPMQPNTMFVVKEAPISKSVRVKKANPSISTTSNGSSITIRHTEYIADISSSGASYAVTKYSINPGLNANFPWLSNVANNYESYRFNRLQYIYKPICPTTTQGKVILGVDYDASDSTPNSKLILNSFESSVSCSPWDSVTHTSTTKNLHKFGTQRYVRPGTQPTGTDIKSYDIGNLYVGTSNTPSTATTLGELYVSYEIQLFTPQLVVPLTIASDENTQSSSFAQQTANITVSTAGAISVAAEYYNQLMWYVYQTQIIGGNTIVDIIVNPNLTKPIRFDAFGMLGSSLGRASDYPATATFGLDYLTTGLNIFNPVTTNFAASWVTRPTRNITGTNTSKASMYRLSLTPNQVFKLNSFALEGFPPLTATALPGIAGPSLPNIDSIVFNWNNPPALSGQIYIKKEGSQATLTGDDVSALNLADVIADAAAQQQ